jgi:radical SAM superfamily enzyme YgiQ (UPF0313 family)
MQLPVPNNPELNTPLAAGYLKAYASAQGLDAAAEIELLPRHLADRAGDALLIHEIVAYRPDVLGVSLYTWNGERSLDIVRRAKEHLPHLRVVVGGPEVQKDNGWVLEHPAVDVAVIGEGEQTFTDLLRLWSTARGRGLSIPLMGGGATDNLLESILGIAYRRNSTVRFTAERTALNNLSVIPSPYLAGFLDVPADGMMMVEVSRWCPYSCSFCLYGRNMGSKLGNRYFGLERVLSEIRWGRDQGIRRVHFVEANLNLVPLFWPLMHALEDLNADRQMTFYAELRGEHLMDDVVAALDRANVRYVEVGLQTANLTALKASLRRTDLRKWAAGTRRLYERGIEVYLDVILGLPADDEAGIVETLEFIRREGLGMYDIFTLQVLPGTAVRQQAGQYGLEFQQRPPYYVLGSNTFSFSDLRRLRRTLKEGAGLPPDAVEGMPEPRRNALTRRGTASGIIDQFRLPQEADELLIHRLAAHVDVALKADNLAAHTPLLAAAITHNPATVFDVYLECDEAPDVEALSNWRETLPLRPGYLDRVAVYTGSTPERGYTRVSPRVFLLLPWTLAVEPADFRHIAEVIWRYELADGDPLPLNAWYGAGGAGICLHFTADCTLEYHAQVLTAAGQWERETGRRIWLADAVSAGYDGVRML